MRCAECRELLSVVTDGEATELERRSVEAHLAGCSRCESYASAIERLNRRLRVRAADPVPDLAERIVAGARAPVGAPRAVNAEWPRYALLWVGLVQVVLAAPALSANSASVHAIREVGSFDLALGVGLLVAAWQPRRAAGLLPMALALVGALAFSATLDVVGGRVSPMSESQHVFDLIGLGALWLCARRAPRRARPAGGLLPA